MVRNLRIPLAVPRQPASDALARRIEGTRLPSRLALANGCRAIGLKAPESAEKG